MRLFRRRATAPPLDEAAAYERCHGTRAQDVRIVKLPPRRERYAVLATGEQLRQLFEERLDAREQDESGARQREAGSSPEPASSPLVPPAA